MQALPARGVAAGNGAKATPRANGGRPAYTPRGSWRTMPAGANDTGIAAFRSRTAAPRARSTNNPSRRRRRRRK
jgi:hypothetical protein